LGDFHTKPCGKGINTADAWIAFGTGLIPLDENVDAEHGPEFLMSYQSFLI